MVRLVALYKPSPDPDEFDRSYFETHLPLMAQVPGLRRTVVSRFSRSVIGENFRLMTEMYFDDLESLKAGMKSAEMAAAGRNLETFASGLTTLLFADEAVNSGQ
jgi:uncharacterized protein (TIGR02118 family)